MNSRARKLSRQYAATLRRYLLRQQESLLQQAYELGRKASAEGFGVLDMARVHQQALGVCLAHARWPEAKSRTLKVAETLFLETLSPFEAAHRGFCEANRELRQSREHYRRLFEQACLMQENLRNLSNKILHVQEAERKRISRELHDEVGQALTAINMNLGLMQRNGEVDAKRLKQKLADTQGLLAQTMETVHRFARELRPAMLDELGLLPALRSYLKGFAGRTGLRVRFKGSAVAEKLNDEQKTVVFRVAQESLTNVARHAHASRVDVTIRTLESGVRMEIKDNGRAFKVDGQFAGKRKKRLGLLGMQERVRLVNGGFAVQSTPGRGTTVQVRIPFQDFDRRLIRYAKDHSAAG